MRTVGGGIETPSIGADTKVLNLQGGRGKGRKREREEEEPPTFFPMGPCCGIQVQP